MRLVHLVVLLPLISGAFTVYAFLRYNDGGKVGDEIDYLFTDISGSSSASRIEQDLQKIEVKLQENGRISDQHVSSLLELEKRAHALSNQLPNNYDTVGSLRRSADTLRYGHWWGNDWGFDTLFISAVVTIIGTVGAYFTLQTPFSRPYRWRQRHYWRLVFR